MGFAIKKGFSPFWEVLLSSPLLYTTTLPHSAYGFLLR